MVAFPIAVPPTKPQFADHPPQITTAGMISFVLFFPFVTDEAEEKLLTRGENAGVQRDEAPLEMKQMFDFKRFLPFIKTLMTSPDELLSAVGHSSRCENERKDGAFAVRGFLMPDVSLAK